MKLFWVIALVSLACLLGYTIVRLTAIARLDNELRATQVKVASRQSLQQDTQRQNQRLAAGVDIASFVETLYACARQAGITDHEVTTSQRLDPAQARRVRRNPGPELKASRLQVVLRSDYRSIADYLRLVDRVGQHAQINRLEMAAEGSFIRMLLLIDLYSLKRSDANVR